jgi:hypothetical protein|tara:strand:- start:4361 stop:5518 length:1158 start_codon:yes stop_codon:yes gene_type:complete
MNSIDSQLEAQIRKAGMEVSNEPPQAALDDINNQSATIMTDKIDTSQTDTPPPPPQPEPNQPAPQEVPVPDQVELSEPVANEPQEVASTEAAEQPMQENESDFDSFLSNLQENSETQYSEGEQENSEEVFELDPRVQAIADFVESTGRDPGDWFTYQSLDSEGMDDITAVRVELSTSYPNLSSDEVDVLLKRKYKLDENLYDEEEVAASKVDLKIAAQNARQTIGQIQENFAAPVQQESMENSSIVDDNWVKEMVQDVNEFEQIEFDLGNDKTFSFGIDATYKDQLKKKNVEIESFFDDYVEEGGQWNFDKWNTDRAVMDNLPNIVQSIYRQGLSDGQRNVVETAANVDASPPQLNQKVNNNPVADSIRQALQEEIGSQRLRFNV